jgi:hypothetical protein
LPQGANKKEYIEMLQEQLSFMALEMDILKKKNKEE